MVLISIFVDMHIIMIECIPFMIQLDKRTIRNYNISVHNFLEDFFLAVTEITEAHVSSNRSVNLDQPVNRSLVSFVRLLSNKMNSVLQKSCNVLPLTKDFV